MAVPRLLKPCEARRSHLTCHVRPRPLAFCVTLMFSNVQRLTKVQAMIHDLRYNTLTLRARPAGWQARTRLILCRNLVVLSELVRLAIASSPA